MKKIMKLILVLFLAIILLACKTETPTDQTGKADNDVNKEVMQKEEVKDESQEEVYLPEHPIPKNLPVYPGAILVNDVATTSFHGDAKHLYFYETDANANEIVEFFVIELEKLGIEIDRENTGVFAGGIEFFVKTVPDVVSLGDSAEEGVDENTKGRPYMIEILISEWD